MKKKTSQPLSKSIIFLFLLILGMESFSSVFAQFTPVIVILEPAKDVAPLDTVRLMCTGAGSLFVSDAKGNVYHRMPAASSVSFVAGGIAGTQNIVLKNTKGNIVASIQFNLNAITNIDDGGKFSSLFNMLQKGMISENKKGVF